MRNNSCNGRKLEGKIKDYFDDQIHLVKENQLKEIFVTKKYTTKVAIPLSDKQKIQTKMRDIAVIWKREDSQADYQPLPNTVSLEDSHKMQFNTPKDLVNFFRYFVNGPYVGRELTPLKTLRIKFISVDLVFAETFGR